MTGNLALSGDSSVLKQKFKNRDGPVKCGRQRSDSRAARDFAASRPLRPGLFFSYRDSNHKTTSTNMSKCDQYHLCWFPRREAHRPEPSPGTDGKKARFGGLFFVSSRNRELVPAPGFELGTY